MRNLTCLQATDHMNQHKELETFVIQIRGNPWLLDHMSVRAGGSGGALLCKMKSRVTLTHSQIGGLDNDYWQAVDGLSLVDDADVDVHHSCVENTGLQCGSGIMVRNAALLLLNTSSLRHNYNQIQVRLSAC